MSQTLRRVAVTGTGSFLPNEPVPNNRIDEVLGRIDNAPQRVQSFIETVGRRMLDGGGIETRHFAINPETHELTHTVSTLGEQAARNALAAAGKTPKDVDLLLLSSPSYDQTTPPTSTTLQEKLGIENCAEMEVHSNCAGVGKCVQIAYDALRLGRYRSALVVYSQLSSVYLRGCYYNQPMMSKTQAMLRYILADGAGALLLESRPAEYDGVHELLGTFVESVGGSRAPGMTAGGGVVDAASGQSPAAKVWEHGSHHLDQDFAAVNRDAGPFLLNGVVRMLASLGLDSKTIQHYIWSTPTLQLYKDNIEAFCDKLHATRDQMKFRAARTGYCGGASILIHFDEMVRSGELRQSERVLLHSVESSKWMSAGLVVQW
ncbi:MAG: 3-oxoacyl-ACP synthase III family protein [Planctomycetes bacterium]|nr:3-oxoacyl-ACP synthase III family protein [Planctomycetota bacterium]